MSYNTYYKPLPTSVIQAPSEAQLNLINKLIAERECGEVATPTTKAEASQVINQLMACKPKAVADAVTEPGMYKSAAGIFKVQKAVHGSGQLYAKKLVVTEDEIKFEYAPGAVKQLKATNRMTLEEAKQFGLLYGTCIVCGRTLTDEKSVEAGIGPVCVKKV